MCSLRRLSVKTILLLPSSAIIFLSDLAFPRILFTSNDKAATKIVMTALST